MSRIALAAATLVALVGASSVAPAAESRPVDCELTVKGKSYIKGVCQFTGQSDGGFQISGDPYFAFVNVTGPGVAEASWNADPKSTHAQAPLGTVRRKGACWLGAGVTICARELPADKRKAVVAAQPDGLGLFPVLPGFSACLGVDGALEAGKAVTLRNCRIPADLIFVRRPDGGLGVSKKPDLCLALRQADAALVLDACQPGQPVWKSAATSTDEATVQSADGRCLVIPLIDKPDAPFPYPVSAQPCAAAGDKAVRFILSKG